MKKKGSRPILLALLLSLVALLVLAPTASSSRTTARAGWAAGAAEDCMSQCHINMSDCLGNGGGYSCIEEFYECSACCNQLLQ